MQELGMAYGTHACSRSWQFVYCIKTTVHYIMMLSSPTLSTILFIKQVISTGVDKN